MIQVKTSVISSTCNACRETLRKHRDKLNQNQLELQEVIRRNLSKDHLQELEQLQNQFQVQLINIHDLKHDIRSHLRKTDYEIDVKNGFLKDDTMAQHEGLLTRFNDLVARLAELQRRFHSFLGLVR